MVRLGGYLVTVLASSLLLGACASNQSIPRVRQVAELPTITKRGVQAGDQVSITFYTAAGTELSEVSGERTVDDNGEVFLPFLGTVSVLGLNAQAIREVLEDRYGTIYADPVIEVSASIHINVTGAVGRPGRFFLPPSATLVDALALAGGAGSEIDSRCKGVPLTRPMFASYGTACRPSSICDHSRFNRRSWAFACSRGIGCTSPERSDQSVETTSASTGPS